MKKILFFLSLIPMFAFGQLNFKQVLTNGSNGNYIPITKLGTVTNADANFTNIMTNNSPGYWQAYSGDAATNHGDCYVTTDAQDSVNPIAFIGAHYYKLTHAYDNYVDLYMGKNSAFIQCNPVNQSFPGLTYLASTASVVAANQGATSILHRAANDARYQQIGSFSGILPIANGGTNTSLAGIGAFNNITGYTASGATGTTSTNLVFSTSPNLTTPNIGVATATSVNKYTWVAPATSATVTVADGKGVTINNSININATADTYTLTAANSGTVLTTSSTICTSSLCDVGAWTDYSASSTIAGFSVFNQKVILYHKIDAHTVLVKWDLSSTSGNGSGTATSFTIPFTTDATSGSTHGAAVGQTANNGSYTNGYAQVNAGTSTILLYWDAAQSNWTNATTRSSHGQMFLYVQ